MIWMLNAMCQLLMPNNPYSILSCPIWQVFWVIKSIFILWEGLVKTAMILWRWTWVHLGGKKFQLSTPIVQNLVCQWSIKVFLFSEEKKESKGFQIVKSGMKVSGSGKLVLSSANARVGLVQSVLMSWSMWLAETMDKIFFLLSKPLT